MDPSSIRELAADLEHSAVRVDGSVLYVTLDRPALRNALHSAAHHELGRVFDTFSADRELRVAVIRGSGDQAFCAGSDLKAKAGGADDDSPASGFAGLTHRFDLDKPVIAAVNGYALGGGLEIVLACDLAITVEHATFGFPEPRVGLAALSGRIQRLVRRIPHKLAMDLLLTGRTIDARTALNFGLVNEVASVSDFDSAVEQRVLEILLCAPPALKATKQVARRSLDEASLQAAVEAEYPAVKEMLASSDAREGPAAFAEKRPPRWKGR